MGELINVHVGNCGNQIGYQFYESIAKEHCIQPDGSCMNDHINGKDGDDHWPQVFFNERQNNRWSPRAVLTDLDPNGVSNVLDNELYGNMFNRYHSICHQFGAAKDWAVGHYTIGAELRESVLDSVRKQAEECDNLHGFQIFHSLGGGTGSGHGTRIMCSLREEYPDKMMSACSVFPSPKMFHLSDSVVEAYNCILGMNQLIELSDFVYCFDNEALFDIQFSLLNNQNPNYKEMNEMIGKVMSDVTCSFRFPPYYGNYNLRKLSTNLVPYPRLHFALLSHASLDGIANLNAFELFQQITDAKNVMSSCDPRLGHYLTAMAIFRGSFSFKEVEELVTSVSNKNSSYWLDWIPNNLKANICKKQGNGNINSATMIGNSTSTAVMFSRIEELFDRMFKRKAFLRGFCFSGMDEMEFTEAQSNVTDIIAEYQQYDHKPYDSDEA